MAVVPYIGLSEVTTNKAGAVKGMVAEFIGTLILVRSRLYLYNTNG